MHLKERMHALDEKNALTQELEKTRKYAEELTAEKGDILKELAKWRMETDQVSSFSPRLDLILSSNYPGSIS